MVKISKIGLLIGQLNNREAHLVENMLQSPLFDTKKEHVQIFQFLFSNRKKVENFQRATINQKIFKSTLTDSKLRLLLSDLYKSISLALVMIHVKDDYLYQDQTLLQRFKNLENKKLYNSQFVRSKKRLGDYRYRNSQYYELKYEIEFTEYNDISSKNRTVDLNLQELLDDLDHIHIGKKLRQACLAIAHQAVYGKVYNYGMLDKIMEYIDEQNLEEIPSIKLYLSGYMMLTHPKSSEHFNVFKQDIDDLKHLFPKEELQTLYILAINQCIRLINRGMIDYGNVALDLYEEALQNKYIYVDGYITRFTYRNIVAIAVKIGEFVRAERFMNENKMALKKEERESAFHFNNALIAYHKRDFDTSLSSIQLVDFKDHLFNLAAKVIQLKVYYESDEYDLLESHLDAMQMYILRKKVIGYHKTNYKNIVRMTRKLLKVSLGDRKSITSLMEEIEQVEVLSERKWLLNQLS